VEANLAALRLLTELRAAGRPATAEEQALLARWSGWGAVPQVFDEHLDTYTAARGELRELLSADGYRAASRTVLNAHYTDGALVSVMWDVLQRLGFAEGDVLEPGCGSGHFLGLAPPGARMVGVERDPTSAGIASLLYPHAQVVPGSFADLDVEEGRFDAAIGNVPFGDFWVHDPRHNPARHSLHNHFLIKALHLTRPGGLVVALTSRYTLDARNPAARREMAHLGDLIGAVRLPSNAHRRAAGTQVVTDLLILRRREPDQPPTDADSWEWAVPRTVANADGTDTTVLINDYFQDHPERVLGELRAKFVPGRGLDLEVLGDAAAAPALAAALEPIAAQAVERGQGLTPPAGPRTPRPTGQVDLIDPDAALFAGFLAAQPDGTFTRRVGQREEPYTPPPAQADELRQLVGIRDLAMALVTAEGHSLDDTEDIRSLRAHLNLAYDTYVATYGPPSRYTPTRTMLAGWGVFKRWCADHDHDPLPAAPDTVRAYLTHLRDAGIGADILTKHLDGIVKAHQSAHDRQVDKVLDRIGARDASARERAAYVAVQQPDHFLFTTATPDVRLDPGAVQAGQEVITSAEATTPAEVDLDELGLRTTAIKRPPQGGFGADPFAGVVRALEVFDPTTQTARKEDIFTQRVINPPRPRLGAETAEEALSICLDTHSRVDVAEIGRLLGVNDTAQVRAELGESVFDDPDTGEVVWAPLYLSGNVRRKLDRARDAAETDPRFAVNVTALQRVVPPDLGPSDVVVQLGSWVQPSYVQQFLRELVADRRVRVEHPLPALWVVSDRESTYAATDVWGTADLNAYQLTELLLSGEEIRVTRLIEYVKPDGDIGERQVLDVEATELARDKAAAIGDRFSAWVWEDTDRAEALMRRYNELFNSEIPTDFSSAQLSTPGLAASITLREHQIAAVARMIYQDGVGLIHDVGAGKTLEIIVGVMERRRRGLTNKAIVVVRNDSIAEQFERQWRSAYPSAQVLTATSDDFTTKGGVDKRAEFVGRVTTGSWDAIIITKDAFQRIPLSADTQREFIQRELDDIRTLRARKNTGLSESATKKTERVLAAAEERLTARLDVVRRDTTGVSFEQTGIDQVVVDEAQDFKNGLVVSKLPDLGIPGSDRAIDLDLKLMWLAERHGHACAVLATATPFTGKFSEVYLWLRRLGHDLAPFDEWARNFIVADSFTEVTPSGGLRPKIRMRRMINEADLWTMLRLTSDVRMADALTIPGLPRMRDDTVEIITVPASVEARIHSLELGRRERALRDNPRRPGKGADNHLVINHHGMQAALDLRVRGISTDEPQKVDIIADDIYREHLAGVDNVYRAGDGTEHPVRGGLILAFCDESIPRPGWNFYQELKDHLVERGMPEKAIRFIHEATTPQAKQDLFTACRTGGVSVLIGSTQRMGAGLNVQDRLLGGYEIIPPRDYRADTSHQARGRVIRQGNQNETVFWKRVVLAPSLDAKKWEIVRQKHDLFAPLLAAHQPGRHRDVDDDESIDLADVMVAATGDPRYTEKAELDQEYKKLTRLQAGHTRTQQAARLRITDIENQLPKQRQEIDRAEQAAARHATTRGAAFSMTVQGTMVTKRTTAAEVLTAALRHEFAATARTRDGRDITIATLGGFTITAQLRPLSQGSTIHLVFAEAGTYTGLPLDHRELPEGYGLITRLENLLDAIPQRPALMRSLLADSEDTLAQARQQVEAPLPHAARLAEVAARRAELTAELSEEDDDPTVDPDSPEGKAQALRQEQRAKERAALAEQVRLAVFEAGGQDPHDFAAWYVAIVDGIAAGQRPPVLTAHKVWIELGRPHVKNDDEGVAGIDPPDGVASVGVSAAKGTTEATQPIKIAPSLAWLADAAMVSTVATRWATMEIAVDHLRQVLPLPFYQGHALRGAWQTDQNVLAGEITAARKTQLSPSGALIAYKAKSPDTGRLAWYVVHTASGAQLGNLLTKELFDKTVLDRGPAITLPDAMIPRYLYALEHCADTEGNRLDWTQGFAELRTALAGWTATTLPVDIFGRLRGAELPAETIGLRTLHSLAVLDVTAPDPLAAALSGELIRLMQWVAPAIDGTHNQRSVAPLRRALASALRDRYPPESNENKALLAVDQDTARVLTTTALWGFGADPATAIRLLHNRIDELDQLRDLEPTLPAQRLRELVLHIAELHTPEPTELERLLRATPGSRLIAAPPDSRAAQPDHTWDITGPPEPVDATPGGRAARLPVTLHHDNGLAHGTLTIDTAATEPIVFDYPSEQPDARDPHIVSAHRLPAVAADTWILVEPDQLPPTTPDELRQQSRRAIRVYLDQTQNRTAPALPTSEDGSLAPTGPETIRLTDTESPAATAAEANHAAQLARTQPTAASAPKGDSAAPGTTPQSPQRAGDPAESGTPHRQEVAPDMAAAALAWWDAGCSVIRVATDGTKSSVGEWTRYQQRRAPRDQVAAWFAQGHPGIGVVCGAVSGDLEMFELEGRAVAEQLDERLRDQLAANGHAELWRRLREGYLERSPSGGLHLLYRVEGGVEGNTKLARRAARDDELTTAEQDRSRDKGKRAQRVLLETRGERGMVVVAPSHGPVHETGQPWHLVAGSPATIPTITAAERDALHMAARSLDQLPPPTPIPDPVVRTGRQRTAGDGVLPGTDFNERGTWEQVLEPHGWVTVGRDSTRTYWRRPGKTRGISATTGGTTGDYLYVFSTSTDLPSEAAMSKWRVYALLDHGGDFSAAAKALRAAGYGDTTPAAVPQAAQRPVPDIDAVATTNAEGGSGLPSEAPAPEPQPPATQEDHSALTSAAPDTVGAGLQSETREGARDMATGAPPSRVEVGEPGSPEPGVWSQRIQVDETASGVIVSGTDRGRDPEELRKSLRDNKFRWRPNRNLWEHAGRASDRAAAAQAIRDLLSELDRREATRSQASPSFPPTAQQQAIINAAVAGQDVAVLALAGTGKTSTLRMLAHAMPEQRIIYIAFNRSIADEAQKAFPRHVTANTMHSFALRALRAGRHAPLLDKLRASGARLPKDVAPALGLTQPIILGRHHHDPDEVARVVIATVAQFRNSADDTIGAAHLPTGIAENHALATLVLQHANQAWADIVSPTGRLVFTHDDYLKIWALTNPHLNADVIFFDEAQDINDVQRQVILDQRTRPDGTKGAQIIVVGDSFQSIYGFRGAKDALQTWPADTRLPLTQSWRFGPAVAALGNQFLALLRADLELEGSPALDSRVAPVSTPDAVLCRTNAGAVTAVFDAHADGRRVALVGGGQAIKDIARAALDLQRGRRTRHPDLSAFSDWEEARDAANTEQAAKHLQPFVRLVDRHGAHALIDMANALVSEDDPNPDTGPQIVVSTAHKAKGREWNQVRIADDFRGPTQDDDGNVVLPGPEELRLSYVTVTRAKRTLELGSLGWIQDYLADHTTPTSHAPDQAKADATTTAETALVPDHAGDMPVSQSDQPSMANPAELAPPGSPQPTDDVSEAEAATEDFVVPPDAVAGIPVLRRWAATAGREERGRHGEPSGFWTPRVEALRLLHHMLEAPETARVASHLARQLAGERDHPSDTADQLDHLAAAIDHACAIAVTPAEHLGRYPHGTAPEHLRETSRHIRLIVDDPAALARARAAAWIALIGAPQVRTAFRRVAEGDNRAAREFLGTVLPIPYRNLMGGRARVIVQDLFIAAARHQRVDIGDRGNAESTRQGRDETALALWALAVELSERAHQAATDDPVAQALRECRVDVITAQADGIARHMAGVGEFLLPTPQPPELHPPPAGTPEETAAHPEQTALFDDLPDQPAIAGEASTTNGETAGQHPGSDSPGEMAEPTAGQQTARRRSAVYPSPTSADQTSSEPDDPAPSTEVDEPAAEDPDADEEYALIEELTGVPVLFRAHHWSLMEREPIEIGGVYAEHWRRHDVSLAVHITSDNQVLTAVFVRHGPWESADWDELEITTAQPLRDLIEQAGLHGVAHPARLPGLWRITVAELATDAQTAAEGDPTVRLVSRPADALDEQAWTFTDDGTAVPLAPPLPVIPITTRNDVVRYVLGDHSGDKDLRGMVSVVLSGRARNGVSYHDALRGLADTDPGLYRRAITASAGQGKHFDVERARQALERLAEGDPALPLNSVGQLVELTDLVRGVVVEVTPHTPTLLRVTLDRGADNVPGAQQDVPVDAVLTLHNPVHGAALDARPAHQLADPAPDIEPTQAPDKLPVRDHAEPATLFDLPAPPEPTSSESEEDLDQPDASVTDAIEPQPLTHSDLAVTLRRMRYEVVHLVRLTTDQNALRPLQARIWGQRTTRRDDEPDPGVHEEIDVDRTGVTINVGFRRAGHWSWPQLADWLAAGITPARTQLVLAAYTADNAYHRHLEGFLATGQIELAQQALREIDTIYGTAVANIVDAAEQAHAAGPATARRRRARREGADPASLALGDGTLDTGSQTMLDRLTALTSILPTDHPAKSLAELQPGDVLDASPRSGPVRLTEHPVDHGDRVELVGIALHEFRPDHEIRFTHHRHSADDPQIPLVAQPGPLADLHSSNEIAPPANTAAQPKRPDEPGHGQPLGTAHDDVGTLATSGHEAPDARRSPPVRHRSERTAIDAIPLAPAAANDPARRPLTEQFDIGLHHALLRDDEPSRLALTYLHRLLTNGDDLNFLAQTVLNVAFHGEAMQIIDRLLRLADRLDTAGYTDLAAGTDLPVSVGLRKLAQRVERKLQTPAPPVRQAQQVEERQPEPSPSTSQQTIRTAPTPTITIAATEDNDTKDIDQPASLDGPSAAPDPLRPAQRMDNASRPDRWARLVDQASRTGYVVRNRYDGSSETDADSHTIWISYDQDPEARIVDLAELVNHLPVVTPIFDDIAHELGWTLPSTPAVEAHRIADSPGKNDHAERDPLTAVLDSLNAKLRPAAAPLDKFITDTAHVTAPGPTHANTSNSSLATTFASLTLKLGAPPRTESAERHSLALPRELPRTHLGTGVVADRRPPLVPVGVEADRAAVGTAVSTRVADRIQSGRDRAGR
jgi:N12 class adenine-specific DNA methylase/SAM-dependent methyltransferase